MTLIWCKLSFTALVADDMVRVRVLAFGLVHRLLCHLALPPASPVAG
jgi:hypothetical protein